MDGDVRRMETEEQWLVSSSSYHQQQQCRLPNNSAAGTALDVEAFIGDVINAGNDLTLEGFNCMEEFLLQKLDLKSEEERHALKQGVDSIYSKVQDIIDESLSRWESTCRDSYFKNYPPNSLTASTSEKITRDGSDNCSGTSCVEDGQEEMLDAELRSLRSQLVAAQREGAKMRRDITSREKRLTSRREGLSVLKSLEESFDGDMHEEIVRSTSLLKDSILKARSLEDSCPRTQMQLLKNDTAGLSMLISTMKVPDGLENGDPAILNLLG